MKYNLWGKKKHHGAPTSETHEFNFWHLPQGLAIFSMITHSDSIFIDSLLRILCWAM